MPGDSDSHKGGRLDGRRVDARQLTSSLMPLRERRCLKISRDISSCSKGARLAEVLFGERFTKSSNMCEKGPCPRSLTEEQKAAPKKKHDFIFNIMRDLPRDVP
jgi:hypothetical protein